MPTCWHARCLLRTYTWLAGSSPTKTAASVGTTPRACENAATSAAISDCIVRAKRLSVQILC